MNTCANACTEVWPVHIHALSQTDGVLAQVT